MVFRNSSEVIKFVAEEMTEKRKENISFCVLANQVSMSDFLPRLIEYSPPLLMCIQKIGFQVWQLGPTIEYRLSVDYGVMPAGVTLVSDVGDFNRAVLSAASLHRGELFLVFREELYEELMDRSAHLTKESDFLSCYLQSLRSEVKRVEGCSYCGLHIIFSYSCSYREYRMRTEVLDSAIKDILQEARRAGIEDWRKAFAVVRYCVNHWTYGSLSENPGMEFTAYGAVVNRRAACMGISLAICRIFKELGIPCRYIQGWRNGEGHAWNKVFILGGWFYIDVTDAICSQNPLYHWGITSFEDGRSMEGPPSLELKCNCPPSYIRACL